jgi:hypothetical protein
MKRRTIEELEVILQERIIAMRESGQLDLGSLRKSA